MAGVVERRLGTMGQGQGVDKYIRKPDPLKPHLPVVIGTKPRPGD